MTTSPKPLHLVHMTVVDFQNTTLRLDLATSRYGTPQPQLDVILPRGSTHRHLSATLHALSADLELRTPSAERWIVQSERLLEPNHGRIYLELSEGDHAEAMRGMMLLSTLMG
ncbi:hypothetical protein HNV26_27990 [Myxococcus xanthus]|nr:hypothetical protein [Myxococcus xanthus]NOJ89421.1 hypothetical protein [Myxococcus xanthus]